MAETQSDVPTHVGYILDGNRRWAKKHGLPTYEGHLAGYNTLKDIAMANLELGVKYMSVYVFSTENWKRSAKEVSGIMSLVLRLFTSDAKQFSDHNIRLRVLGSRDGLDKKIVAAIEKLESDTSDFSGGTLAVCLNYGGQQEIADVVRQLIRSDTKEADITTELIESLLYSSDIPPMDLIVRTSGEQRISNFMLWRAAYSELLFLDKLWPDMTKDDVIAIMKEYSRRQRRFGG